MQKWEYDHYFYSYAPRKRDLDEKGEDGWELIAIIEDETEAAGKGFRLYFKRPKTVATTLSPIRPEK